MKFAEVIPASVHYEIERLIGQGSQGCVYKARRVDERTRFSQPVAIKVLKSKNSVPIWKAEIESLSAVRSKNCVGVLAFDWWNDRPAIVLELIDGINLMELVEKGVLYEDEIDWIIFEIAAGLSDLHKEGLVHGDLSPRNVMITSKGEVKLLDFGYGNQRDGSRFTKEFAAASVLFGEEPTKSTDFESLHLLKKWMEKKSVTKSGVERSQLAQRVREILDCKDIGSTQSFEITSPKQSIRPLRRRILEITSAILLVLMVGQSSHGKGVYRGVTATVSLRSSIGYDFSLNDRKIGYAPTDVNGISPGDYVLSWSRGLVVGQRTLTLRPGEHIVLDDDFFKAK